MNTLFGTKVSMSQAFIEGFRVPVTKVNLGPCIVTQVKTLDKDGYNAIQIGLGSKKDKNTTKPLQGHYKKVKETDSKIQTPRYVKEIKLNEEPTYKVGDLINASQVFNIGDVVEVRSKTKGKGFAGGVRRYNFRGGPKTHGQSDRHRAPGSVGQTTTPGRVYKGKRMAGRMGSDEVTIKNLKIVSVDNESNQVLISGAIPGRKGTFVRVNKI